jgi:hypothetical protein
MRTILDSRNSWQKKAEWIEGKKFHFPSGPIVPGILYKCID